MTEAVATAHPGMPHEPVTGRGIAAIAVPAASIALVVVAALALGRSGASDPLTGSVAWLIGMPVALAATIGIAVWVGLWPNRRLAGWIFAAAAAGALYWLAGAITGTLESAGATDTVGFTLLACLTGGSWCLVLAIVQCAAVVAGQEAGVLARRQWPLVVLLSWASLATLIGVLVVSPEIAPVPVFPASVTDSPVTIAVVMAVVQAWMLSLLVLPVTLFVLAARSNGTVRRTRARLALGALGPALVVFVCGMLAALLADVGQWRSEEGFWLAVGFCAALPLTTGWIAATVREATAAAGGWFTSLATALRVSLWMLYVLGAISLIALVTPSLGADAAAGAVAMALVLGVTFWPWSRLVRWAVRRFDVRTTVAEAAVAALRPDGAPAGPVCDRVAAEALGDPDARVLLARPGGRWVDTSGAEARPASDVAVLTVTDAAARPLGIIEHHTRFADLRPLALALRPLFERVAWEAELREQSERVAAERARADGAAAEARRRIERDLHDGVQGRLVSLGLGLSLARDGADDPISRDVLDRAVAELQGVVGELRDLSHGSLSDRLVGAGLARAVADLVERMPVPVDLEIPASVAAPASVESAAYFVIAESLTNAVKHASPSRIRVVVTAAAPGGALSVVVTDDGCGGADARAGTGLRGLTERVHAVGGHLVVSDRAPSGTLVEAVLPCGP